MSSWKILSVLALLSPVASYACTGTWNGTTGTSNWTTTTWMLSGCSGTYPGEFSSPDTAIFPSGAASPATLDINAPITLNVLTFDNNTNNPAYTISGPDTLTFAGTAPVLNDELGTQIISAPIALDTDTLTIAIVNAGDTLTLSGGMSDSGTSSLSLGSVANPSAGTLVMTNTNTLGGSVALNGGTFNNAKSMTASGTSSTLTFAGATVNSNNSSTSPFSCSTATSGPILTAATVNINSGIITIDSACGTLATAGVVGTTIQSSTNALTISGGTVNATNEAAISATGDGATGSLLTGVGVTVSAGNVILTNTGTISGASDTGVFLYSNTLASGNPMTFSGGTVTATNNGSVMMGVGALVQSGSQGMFNNPINVSGGTLILANTINLMSTTAAMGASLGGGALTVSAGSLNLNNTGNLSSFPGQGTNGIISGNITVSGGSMTLLNGTAASPNTTGSLSGSGTLGGVEITASGNFIQSGGSFTNENAGIIAVGTGSFTNIAGTTSLSTGGTFTNSNSGNVTNPSAIGSYFLSGGNIGLGAGITVNLSNSGTITAGYPGSVGSYIRAPTITDSGSTLNITNSGSVSGYAPVIGFPGTIGSFLYSTESTTLTGGTWMAKNTGAVPAGGTGIQIECDTTFTLGGNASITMTNDTAANVSTLTSIGCQLIVLNTLNFPSGSTSELSLINNQAMTSGRSGVQATIQLGTSMAAGTLSMMNTNTIGSSTGFNGVLYLIDSGAFIQTGGTVNMTNSGTISSTASTASGVGLKVSGSQGMSLTGGSFNMTNSSTGTINSASAGVIGITTNNSGLLTIGGTAAVAVTNNGPVSSPTVGAIGCELTGLGITMNGGTLTLINNGTISGLSSNVGAYLNNSNTGPMTFSGGTFSGTNNSASVGSASGVKVISGPPGVSLAPIVVDGGTAILTNTGNLTNTSSSAGTYIQGSSLTVSAGSLTLSNSGNLTGFSSEATTGIFSSLAITGGSTTLLNSGSLSGGGAGVQATAQTGTTMSGGTFNVTNTGNLSGTSKGAVFLADVSFNQTGGAFTVSNSGTNSGSGNASYILSPAITISGTGTFNNPTGLVAATTVTLTAGGILQSGTATVPGVFQDASFGSTTIITNNGGTFVSGTLDATPGQTTMNGTFTQTSGTYTIVIGNLNLPSNQGISFLTVNGTGVVNLDGGTLNVIPATGFNVATDIPAGLGMVQFIQASTKINGGFSPLKINNSVPGLAGMSYETLANNQGWLLFSLAPPAPPPPAPLMPTSTPIPYQPMTIATVNFINTFLGRELLRMQERLITNDQAYDDREHKKSSQHPKKSAHTPVGPRLSLLKHRAHMIADTAITDADPEVGFMNYQSQTKQQQLASEIRNDNPWNIYCGPLADFGKINNKRSQLGAHFHSFGGLAGVDYRFSQVGVGILFDYENVKAKVHKHGGDFSINQFHATAYSTYVPAADPRLAINGMVGSGGAWYNIHRHISELKESTHAKSCGAEVDALLGAQYLFSHCQFAIIPPDLEIIPMVNLQYVYQGIGSYKEHGAGINDFKFHKYGFQSLRSALGTWLQYCKNWENFSLTSLVNISWQCEFLDQNQTVNMTPINDATPSGALTIFGAARNTLLAGLDLLFEFYNTYGVEASYDFEYNSLYHNSAFYVGLNVRF